MWAKFKKSVNNCKNNFSEHLKPGALLRKDNFFVGPCLT